MPTGLLSSIKNALLAQTAQQVEATVKPELKQDYLAVIVSGMKIMFSPDLCRKEVLRFLNSIKGPHDVPRYIGHGIVKLISIILKESQRKADLADPIYAASIPAAIVLMCYALEFVDKRMPITNDLIAKTTTAVTKGLYTLYGITPEMVQKAVASRGQSGAMPPGPPTAGTAGGPPPPSPMRGA